MRLFIPNQGVVDSRAYLVDAAVKQYDERLMFSRNADTGDWCVFIDMPRPEPPYPVLGFGDDIPDPEIVVDRLRRGDTLRSGDRIYNEIVKSQEAYRSSLKYNADQAVDESVEVIEHFMRKEGKSPIVKSFSKGVSE